MISKNKVQAYLDPNIALLFYDELASTNECPKAHAYPIALVLTKQQTQGKGQHNRVWKSNENSSLTFSFYHRQKISPMVSFWQIIVANVVADQLDNVALKWPNDLIFNGGKCGGILVETHIQGSQVQVISGIGLNIKPIEATHDTYIVTTYPLKTCPNKLIAAIANDLMKEVEELDIDKHIELFNSRHIFQDERVNITDKRTHRNFQATVIGIDKQAGLIVMNELGELSVLTQHHRVRPI